MQCRGRPLNQGQAKMNVAPLHRCDKLEERQQAFEPAVGRKPFLLERSANLQADTLVR